MFIYIRKKTALLCGGTLLVLLAVLLSFQPHIPAAGAAQEAISLPIIMYHSVLKDPAVQGAYVVSPSVFEEDIKYLKEHGYSAVFVAEVADWVAKGSPLPQKPVILSFDDGNLNNLTYILPLLEQYDMRAVISVVGEFVERAVAEDDHNPAYSYLTWEEINQVLSSGRVEIGNHTFALHNAANRRGATPKRGEPKEQYQQLLAADLLKLQDTLQEKCGVTPITFAYPYGFIHEASLPVIRELGFKASFSCGERVNLITREAESLFCLGRYNRPAGISTEAFMRRVLN